jgi:hypothetical protein
LAGGILLVSLVSEAQAKRDFSSSCGRGGCHTSEKENSLTVTNNDDTIDLGLGDGLLKVFDFNPITHTSINLDVAIANFYNTKYDDYAVAVDNLGAMPLSSSSGWNSLTGRDGSKYFATSHNNDANKTWTYNLDIADGTPEGYYLFEFTVGGKVKGTYWSDTEEFYVRVILPVTMGDTNGNHIVDSYDYGNLVAQLGAPPPDVESADFNDDGIVNLEDFVIMRGNFGFGLTQAAPNYELAAAAPEPTTLSLLLLGGLAMLRRRRTPSGHRPRK